ncbi:MAG TPA: polysaccharide deacetylase family protein [Spirochaetia bacterium]|nr:polysaccharide deacetylase family protein [Spirochaetia bacterium]
MKLPALVCAALLVGCFAFSQAAQPQTRVRRLVPPNPRDGEGTATTVVPILIFHAIRPYIETDTTSVRRYIATPETLERELAYLRAGGYTSVTFDDLANHIMKAAALPQKPVIISFDDDWVGQYTYALPLLKKYGYTATFYIWVAVVGRKHHMTWDEIRELSSDGMQIGCHTITHPYLTRVKKDQTLRREILGAKQIIEERVGVPVTTIAYPFGQYDERVVAMAKEAGFTSARSTWPGVIHSQEGLFSLTGLIRTERDATLVATMERYLTEAAQRIDGTVVPEPSPDVRPSTTDMPPTGEMPSALVEPRAPSETRPPARFE